MVAVLFAVNLALLSTRIAQTGEDTVRERLLQATTALHAQLELIDARLSPKAAAEVPELAEATKGPADPAQPPPRPDDRALRAAASALAPEPDLLAVVNAQGALVSRRARPVEPVADIAQVPLAKDALERSPLPSFVVYQGTAYRMAAARVPGSAAAVVAGTAADDRLAAQLKSQVDADVTLIANGKVVASSLPAEGRDRVSRWAAAPGPGYGVLPVVLPGIGSALSGRLPRGASRYAVRGTIVPLDGGVEAALTVPASPYVGWLARYQAFSLLALALLVLFGFLWGLLSREPARLIATSVAPPEPRPARRSRPVVGTDATEGRSGANRPSGDVPWTSAAAAEAVPEPAVVVGDVAEPAGPSWDAPPPEPRLSGGARGLSEEAASEPAVPELAPPERAMSEPALSDAALAEPAAPAPAFSDPALSEPGPGAKAADVTTSDTSSGTTRALENEDEDAVRRDVPTPTATADAVRRDAPAPTAPADAAREKNDFSFAGLLDDAAAPIPLPGGALPVRQGEAEWAAAVDAGQRPATDEAADAWGGARPAPAAVEHPGFEMVAPSSDLDAPAVVAPNPSAEAAYLEAAPASSTTIEREYLHRPDAEAPQRHLVESAAPAEAASSETAPAEAASSESAPAEPASSEAAPTEPAPTEAAPPGAAATERAPAETSAPVEPQPETAAAGEPQADPDEAHWHETYDAFIALREQLGEQGRISYERFAAKLAKNREDLIARRQCRGVRFSVYEKEGRASIKASAVR